MLAILEAAGVNSVVQHFRLARRSRSWIRFVCDLGAEICRVIVFVDPLISEAGMLSLLIAPVLVARVPGDNVHRSLGARRSAAAIAIGSGSEIP